jgi:glycosyltransferase involved in cell wall biosynthesis
VALSYRLGGRDGVSVEAKKWEWALHTLGFEVRRVAGNFDAPRERGDTRLPFLAIDPPTGTRPDVEALTVALADADLVVVENLCSLPLNLAGARAAAEVLAGFSGRVLFHHHDLPWERVEFAEIDDFPPNLPGSLHVAISEQAQRALSRRGFEAFVIRNVFETDPPVGDRNGTRRGLGFVDQDLVVLQPTRAIPRKEVGRGLRLAEQIAGLMPGRPVRFWLTGAAEDGYGPTLDELWAGARVSVTHRGVSDVADAYAAADLVVMPSSWEGFGNPVIEAMVAERPVAAAGYPVLDELRDLGLLVLPLEDPNRVASFLHRPDLGWLRRNHDVVRRELSIGGLPGRLLEAFARVGWDDW